MDVAFAGKHGRGPYYNEKSRQSLLVTLGSSKNCPERARTTFGGSTSSSTRESGATIDPSGAKLVQEENKGGLWLTDMVPEVLPITVRHCVTYLSDVVLFHGIDTLFVRVVLATYPPPPHQNTAGAWGSVAEHDINAHLRLLLPSRCLSY